MNPVAAGLATFAGAGSPFNKVAGLGFGGVPGEGELAEVERAFAFDLLYTRAVLVGPDRER